MQGKINEIKEKIHTINPQFKNELLDLLYEYVITRQNSECQKKSQTSIQTQLYAEQFNIKGIIAV